MWIGLGAVLASTVINVVIFILAATFLKGALRCAVLGCTAGSAATEQRIRLWRHGGTHTRHLLSHYLQLHTAVNSLCLISRILVLCPH